MKKRDCANNLPLVALFKTVAIETKLFWKNNRRSAKVDGYFLLSLLLIDTINVANATANINA